MRYTFNFFVFIMSLNLAFSAYADSPHDKFPNNNVCSSIASYINHNLYTPKGAPYIVSDPQDVQENQVLGASFGVYQNGYVCYYNFGKISADSNIAPTEDTVYQLGSLTKVFTAALTVEASKTFGFSLTEKIVPYLPSWSSIALQPSEQSVTFQQLLTHTGGFPDQPSALTAHYPYSVTNYTEAQFGQYINSITPPSGQLPAAYSYSNAGFALLGQIVANLWGLNYDGYGALVQQNIAQPLNMASTGTNLIYNDSRPVAMSYKNCDGQKCSEKYKDKLAFMPSWPTQTPWDGAIALYSTAADMIELIKAELGVNPNASPALQQAMAETQIPVGPPFIAVPSLHNRVQALAWEVQQSPLIISKNGRASGFTSFLGLYPEKKLGLVLLTNTSLSLSIDQNYMGLKNLNAIPPLVIYRVDVALGSTNQPPVYIYPYDATGLISFHNIISKLDDNIPSQKLDIVANTSFALSGQHGQCPVRVGPRGNWAFVTPGVRACWGVHLPTLAGSGGLIQLPDHF